VISVTLDSNIYISALQFGGATLRLLDMARAGMIRLDVSDAILTETIGVLRDKFHWQPYQLHFARLELRRFANLVQPTETRDVTDDPDDNRVLECAIAAGSDYIVTNDDDLLRLEKHCGISILSAVDFFERMRKPE
jgi:putative PIN family toxin of toxin-antitoxin system